MDDMWGDVRERMKKIFHHRSMKQGIFCFQVHSIGEPKNIVNKYDKVSKEKRKKYLASMYKGEDAVSEYIQYPVIIRAKLFPRIPEGHLVQVPFTAKILCYIRESLDKFRNYDMPEPEYIVYWKPTMMIVRYTFLYEHQYKDYEMLLKENDVVKLKAAFYWLGVKEYYDERRFIDWYGGYKDDRI